MPRGSLTSSRELKTRKTARQVKNEKSRRDDHFLTPFALSMRKIVKKAQKKNPTLSTRKPKIRRLPRINEAPRVTKESRSCLRCWADFLKEEVTSRTDRPPMTTPARKGKNPGPGLLVCPRPSFNDP